MNLVLLTPGCIVYFSFPAFKFGHKFDFAIQIDFMPKALRAHQALNLVDIATISLNAEKDFHCCKLEVFILSIFQTLEPFVVLS